jgi:hypothetical protein
MEDCFAMSNGGCGALKVNKCPKNCKFYKTHQQLRIERQKTYNRLMELGRLDLIDTYKVQAE